MEETLDRYETVRYKYSSAFTKYVETFNLMELNIGLCISFLVNRHDPKASHPFLDRLTTHAKMDVLKELVKYKGPSFEGSFKRDFEDWFKLALQSKASRNQYIHGHWDVMPHLEKPIRFTPIKWMNGIGGDNTEKMTLNEFVDTMAEINDVFETFMQLREKYGI